MFIELIKDYGRVGRSANKELVVVAQLGYMLLEGWNGEIYEHAYKTDSQGYAVDDDMYRLQPVYDWNADSDQGDLIGFDWLY